MLIVYIVLKRIYIEPEVQLNTFFPSLYEHMIGCESSCSVKGETKIKNYSSELALSAIDFNFYI